MNILSLINGLIGPLWEGLKALLFFKQGQKSQQLKQQKQENKNAKESAKRKNNIDSLPPSDVDDIV